MSPEARPPIPVEYSVIIPVYNSAGIVGETIDRTAAFFEKRGWRYEIIALNDGSRDESWEVLRDRATRNSSLVAINLSKNYGQHTALYCGFQKSRGRYVLTLDDDLQNPPEEMIHLIDKMRLGYDAVFARFATKHHPLFRRIGSHFIHLIDTVLFGRPMGLAVTNFRIIRRDVVERVCSIRTPYPYIRGLILKNARHASNVMVRHEERKTGKSQYNAFTIARFVIRIFLSYAFFNYRRMTALGILLVGASFALAYFLFGNFAGTASRASAGVILLSLILFGVASLILGVHAWRAARALRGAIPMENYNIKEIVESRINPGPSA